MSKDFWLDKPVAMIGSGHFATVLTSLMAARGVPVRMWMRSEVQAKAFNLTRRNPKCFPEVAFPEHVVAYSNLASIFEVSPVVVILVVATQACREVCQLLAEYFNGSEIVLHSMKGLERVTGYRISEVILQELPVYKVGMIAGPHLSKEILALKPTKGVIASVFREVAEVGCKLLGSEAFVLSHHHNLMQVEWCSILKNIFALVAGALSVLDWGYNFQAVFYVQCMHQMALWMSYVQGVGSAPLEHYDMAGLGDLIATCSSPLSRNFQIGYCVAQGELLEVLLERFGEVVEGVVAVKAVAAYAKERGLEWRPVVLVDAFLQGELKVEALGAAWLKL